MRSFGNYPKLLAATLRVYQFTDVSCGGADTTKGKELARQAAASPKALEASTDRLRTSAQR
ncbi:hypothetical protein ACIBL3_07615 [Kribbella sp. NPDC050124]|uniref:hypothetical protein n=1 Tax=Kribbella sp. NPDC050124 TaxID=3364114 RepID=UPI0037B6EE0E